LRIEKMGPHTLYLGDCREILPSLAGIDAVITDPPYGISQASNRGFASWDGVAIANDHDTSARDWVAQWSDGRAAAYFGTWKRPAPADTRACVVWDKGPAFGMGDLSLPWKPSFELVYVCGKGWAGRRGEGVIRGGIVVTWESKGRDHPHQKPVWVSEHFIERMPEAVTICDPFMGSGSTGVACARMGRKFVGIEIDPKHFDSACRRLDDALKQPDLFVETTV
jgi:DNA modification methylase